MAGERGNEGERRVKKRRGEREAYVYY